MDDRVQEILETIRRLERDLIDEVQKKQEEFFYQIQERKVRFDKAIREKHRALKTGLLGYILFARPLAVLTAPIIWFCAVPALLLDLVVTLYQAVCFPAYGIPKVNRSHYIVIDRHNLAYLNIIEKFNCFFCAYFNGLIGYVEEVAARTEQHWCPIKHARPVRSFHSRYRFFLDYGDAEAYRERIRELRRAFDDLR